MSWIWCNGEFSDGFLSASPSDRGLTNGLGLFETLLAVDGRPVALQPHLIRMKAGAGRLRWHFDGSRIGLAIVELLRRANLETGRARVRIAMTAGTGDLGDLEQGPDALIWVVAAACPPPPESIAVVTLPFPRNERSPLVGLKCASYAENLVALDHARLAGAGEGLFFNTRDELCEGATSNVFLVHDGKVMTPPLESGCLPGTMRERVIARSEVEERVLSKSDLDAADEIFITSSTRGVLPVTRVDDRSIPPGPVSESLRSAAWELG